MKTIANQQTQIAVEEERSSSLAPIVPSGGKFTDATRTASDAIATRERRDAADSLVATLAEIARKKRAVDETMALLLHETRAMRSRRRHKMALRLLLCSVVFLTFFHWHQHVFSWYWIFQVSGGGWWMADKAANARKDAARMLTQAEDPRAVGVLAVALRDGDAPVQQLAETALLKLLPQVRASHAGYVDADQMAALLSIAHGDDASLKVALLRALEQIGDSRAIPTVEHLLRDNWKIVRNQAEQCLPYLRERARRARESATLLRASHPAASSLPAQLLRPANDSSRSNQASELLRPDPKVSL